MLIRRKLKDEELLCTVVNDSSSTVNPENISLVSVVEWYCLVESRYSSSPPRNWRVPFFWKKIIIGALREYVLRTCNIKLRGHHVPRTGVHVCCQINHLIILRCGLRVTSDEHHVPRTCHGIRGQTRTKLTDTIRAIKRLTRYLRPCLVTFLLKFNFHYINVPLDIWNTKCRLITCMSTHISSNLWDESIKPS
jgi:hypothetical protein